MGFVDGLLNLSHNMFYCPVYGRFSTRANKILINFLFGFNNKAFLPANDKIGCQP